MTTMSVATAVQTGEAVTPTDNKEAPEGAVASLICGILAFATPLVGIALGIIAIALGNKARKLPNGRMGMAGFVLGIITTATYGLALSYIIGVAIYIVASAPGTAG
jgi:hypothetical protein